MTSIKCACFLAAAMAAGLACSALSGEQVLGERPETSWLRRPVFYALEEEPLTRFLVDFSNRQGVSSQISPSIKGTVSGKFNMVEPERLLTLITRSAGIQWYYDGGQVFFYGGDEIVNESFNIKTLTLENVKDYLRSVNAYDPRYNMRVMQKGDEITLYVNAPPRYIEMIRDIVARYDIKEKENKVMQQFRLRHAWARDQKLTFSDGEQTVPGVASFLRQIVATELQAAGLGEQRAISEAQKTIMPDMRLNAVLVFDVPERMSYYESLIRDLDQDTELVEIRAAIIDVGVDFTRDLGISWAYQRADGRGGVNANHTEGSSGAPALDENGLLGFGQNLGDGLKSFTILGGGINQLMARVNALESKGNAKVLSRPTILTTDNVQALIERSETFYVRMTGTEVVNLEKVTYGTKLQVTPHVINHPDGRKRIQLQIIVEDGSTADSGEVDNIPRTVNSTVSTHAVVGEGQALVIGGHYSEVLKDSQNGVPVLSKIPGFGNLFRNKRKDANTYERLFVISPRIVTVNDLPEVSENDALGETFDNHAADPVFKMPSVSDSRDAIVARRQREIDEDRERGFNEDLLRQDELYPLKDNATVTPAPPPAGNGNGNGAPARNGNGPPTRNGNGSPARNGGGAPAGGGRDVPPPPKGISLPTPPTSDAVQEPRPAAGNAENGIPDLPDLQSSPESAEPSAWRGGGGRHPIEYALEPILLRPPGSERRPPAPATPPPGDGTESFSFAPRPDEFSMSPASRLSGSEKVAAYEKTRVAGDFSMTPLPPGASLDDLMLTADMMLEDAPADVGFGAGVPPALPPALPPVFVAEPAPRVAAPPSAYAGEPPPYMPDPPPPRADEPLGPGGSGEVVVNGIAVPREFAAEIVTL